MKTQPLGTLRVAAVPPINYNLLIVRYAAAWGAFKENRGNGNDPVWFKTEFPSCDQIPDQFYAWATPDGRRFPVQRDPKDKDYLLCPREVRYQKPGSDYWYADLRLDESPQMRACMERRDVEYIRQLRTLGKLLEKEPNGDKEIKTAEDTPADKDGWGHLHQFHDEIFAAFADARSELKQFGKELSEKERQEREKQEREKQAREKQEREKLEREKQAREKLEREKQAREAHEKKLEGFREKGLLQLAKDKNIEGVRYLFSLADYKLNINQIDADGNTALHYLMSSWTPTPLDLIFLCVDKGAQVLLTNRAGQSPLDLAFALPFHEELLRRFIDRANQPLALHLSGISFTLDHFRFLHAFIMQNQYLTSLDLSNIQLTEAQGRLLLQAIKQNHHVTEMSITGCGLKKSIAMQIKIRLKRNAQAGERHSKLEHMEEVGVSAPSQEALLAAVANRDATEVTRIVHIEKRLLTKALQEGEHLLSLSLRSSSEVVRAVLTALGDEFWGLPEIEAGEGIGFFQTAAEALGAPGARLIQEKLEWQAADIQKRLVHALVEGKLTVALVCLELGAKLETLTADLTTLDQPFMQDAEGKTILHQAILERRYDVVDALLITKRCCLSLKSAEGKTALDEATSQKTLFAAATENDWPMVKRLILLGADMEALHTFDQPLVGTFTAKDISAKRLNVWRAFQARNTRLATVHTTNPAFTLLHLAAQEGDLATVQAVVEKGEISVDRECSHKKLAMDDAVEHRQRRVITYLMTRSPLNHQDEIGQTILHKAVLQEEWALVDGLLEAQVDTTLKDGAEKTALKYAEEKLPFERLIREGKLVEIERLIRLGLDINTRDTSEYRRTLLHHAVLQEKPDMVRRLLTMAGLTPALEIDLISAEGQSALHYAADKGHLEIIKLLVEVGRANLFVMDGLDQTPRKIAIDKKHSLVGQYLKLQEEKKPSSEKKSDTPIPPSPGPAVHADGRVELSLEIPYSELTYQAELGKGGFGKVYSGTWRGYTVAIKQLTYQGLSKRGQESLLSEAAKMVQLTVRDPDARIVRIYGVCTEPSHYGLVMELMPKGSLFHLLQNKGQDLPWSIRWNIATDMAHGLTLIHDEKMLHRDLKSLNVLLDGNLRAKISDFGLADVKDETKTTTSTLGGSAVGTVSWMAPEIFGIKPKYSERSDIYAYGVVMWELAACQLPYKGVDASEIRQAVKDGEREEIPAATPPKFAALIARCWAQRTETRPASREIVLELEGLRKQGLFGNPGAGGAADPVTTILPGSDAAGYRPM